MKIIDKFLKRVIYSPFGVINGLFHTINLNAILNTKGKLEV